MSATTNLIGKPVDRVDGPAKVTGKAMYALDTPIKNVAHAVMVLSTIGAGKIASIRHAGGGEFARRDRRDHASQRA